MILSIPYGKKELKINLAADRLLGLLASDCSVENNVGQLLSISLNNPEVNHKLKSLLCKNRHILLVVPDATRNTHLKEILPLFLKISDQYRCRVDIIVATGLHKKHSPKQLKNLFGEKIVRKCKILSHDQDEKELINLGKTKNRIPIILNKHLQEYGGIISIGVIEPHLYAGYSGGPKTVAIGLAGEETINATHSLKYLDNPLTRLGSIKNNPFQDALWEILESIAIDFTINIVNSNNGEALKIFSGDIKDVYKKGIAFAKKTYEIGVSKTADIVIAGVGYPKDINLYQASRAINYVLNVDRPVLKKGGVLVIVASLTEGVGGGLSEKRFYKELKKMTNPIDFIKRIKKEGFLAGAHRAFMVAKPLLDYKVVFVSSGHKKFMNDLPFVFCQTLEEGLAEAEKIVGKNSKIYIIPHALATIARVKKAEK